ncbi:MAG: polysaccharide deacetylase family protein [Desulfobulbaceae bacterium]|nr:polysaccharide deacetylase family protein [Desulfobulbaceae bacterium]HIJ79290.1 polysaccharide deacetylase family protein [Deltaproteobacteria bacterium]
MSVVSQRIFRILSAGLLCAVFFLSGLLPASNVFAASSVEEIKLAGTGGDVTIFIYHHFGDNRYPSTNVGMDEFGKQMQFLADNGYTVIPLTSLVSLLKDQKKLPAKAAVITIDDGYQSIYTKAWPVLKSFGYPFTVFLYVEGVERRFKNYLNWEQIKEMQEEGVDFQDHSYSHHRMADWPQGLTENEYRQWIRADLVSSVNVLRERLGKRPQYFAIPYGEYNSIVMEEAKAIGYEAIFTQDPGTVSSDTDICLIPREPILGNEWSTMAHFQKVLKRVDLPLAGMTPTIAPLDKQTPTKFGGRLLYPERYVPSSFGIYVSELGWQPAKLDNGFVYINNVHPLTRRSNRVMISAKEKGTGRIAVRFWLLMQHEISVSETDAMKSVLHNQSLQQ